MIEATYFDPNGKPTMRSNRLHPREEIVDLFGRWRNQVLAGALDREAVAKIQSGGFSRIVQAFDDRGNPVRRAFFGVEGTPATGPNGAVEETVEYDKLDRPIVFRPIVGDATSVNREQIWTRLTYDDAYNLTRIDYISPDGRIVDGKRGYATVRIEPRDGPGRPAATYLTAAGETVKRP